MTIALDDDVLIALEEAKAIERLSMASICRREMAKWANEWRSQGAEAA
jgi:hypothetical protein